ncbi:hypothetical protein C5167_034813 [Papaver somniferum]|uniref:Uncharacterized protein n=1 Tax=Papaver somniferum TaxID=3469 RepID=A0A4Y7KHY8_PAPSO|nr:hypothetical protein C5167_034813 [Papaver somniferum]
MRPSCLIPQNSQEPMSNNDTMGIGGSAFLQVVHSTATISQLAGNMKSMVGPQLEATMKLIMQYLTKGRERVNSGGRMWYLKMNN